jgi:hypothetical protein
MSLQEFVPAQFPLPFNPLIHGDLGMGDFVPAGFPLPQIPIRQGTSPNSLVAAPPIYQSQINPVTTQKAIQNAALAGIDRPFWYGNDQYTAADPGRLREDNSAWRLDEALIGVHVRAPSFVGLGGCGCGGGCGGCGGMGTLTSDTIIPQASLPTFLQGDAYITGFPTVYLAGAIVLTLGVMMMGGKRGRRR